MLRFGKKILTASSLRFMTHSPINDLLDPSALEIEKLKFSIRQKNKCLHDAFAEIKDLHEKNNMLTYHNKTLATGVVELSLTNMQLENILFRNENVSRHEIMIFVKMLIENIDDSNKTKYLIIKKYNELYGKSHVDLLEK